jgi:uncharacterized membrane-anchored protein
MPRSVADPDARVSRRSEDFDQPGDFVADGLAALESGRAGRRFQRKAIVTAAVVRPTPMAM